MRLAQGEEHPELQVRLPAAEHALEVVSRNVHGQSLEEAQEEFGWEWEDKIRDKRVEMEEAQRRERWWANYRPQVYLRGASYGAFFAGVAGLYLHDLPGLLLGVVGGAIVGEVVVVPLIILSVPCEIWFQKRAERLKRELRELVRA